MEKQANDCMENIDHTEHWTCTMTIVGDMMYLFMSSIP